jgi:hypothetical protein
MATMTDLELSAYTLEVYPHFSIYEWRLDVSVTDTTNTCTISDECGCCDCEKDSVMRNEYSRPRYSKSRKVWELETHTNWTCETHQELSDH